MKRLLPAIFFLFPMILTAENREKVLVIDSQDRMDALPGQIASALEAGYRNITCTFRPGTFFFDESLLCLDGLQYPETRLHFLGNGATLTGKGQDYSDGNLFSGRFDAATGVTSSSGDVFLWSGMYQADEPVQILDKDTHLCRIRCNALHKEDFADLSYCHILLTEWFLSRTMKVTDIGDGTVTFCAEELDAVNADYAYARIPPRFKLLNMKTAPFHVQEGKVRLSGGLDKVHVSQSGRLFSASGARFRSISFEGFRFLGNRDEVFALLDFTQTTTEGISITGCEFCGLRSKLVQVASSPGFKFSGNSIHDCYRGGIFVVGSVGARISDNFFRQTGLAMCNDFCVWCAGENYRIWSNKFCNFGYGGIAVGMHFTQERNWPLTGIVEYNELWYTQSYCDDYRSHTLMDSGAIYAFTQNDRVLIRNNYIHDFVGMRDNRGIFLDDGACNVTVRGNTILRIANSWCIDSRLVPEVETLPGSQVRESNRGVVIEQNRTDGKIRFEKRR